MSVRPLRVHIAEALAPTPPAGVDPVVALVTVLAAQCDPDTDLRQRLWWTRAYDPAVVAACRGAA